MPVRDGDGREGGAVCEGTFANCRYSVRDGDGREGGASPEGFIGNRRHSLCKSHFCEFTIVSEPPCLVCAIVYCCLGHFPRLLTGSGGLVWCDGVRARERDGETLKECVIAASMAASTR
jgi:hypothetical protein